MSMTPQVARSAIDAAAATLIRLTSQDDDRAVRARTLELVKCTLDAALLPCVGNARKHPAADGVARWRMNIKWDRILAAINADEALRWLHSWAIAAHIMTAEIPTADDPESKAVTDWLPKLLDKTRGWAADEREYEDTILAPKPICSMSLGFGLFSGGGFLASTFGPVSNLLAILAPWVPVIAPPALALLSLIILGVGIVDYINTPSLKELISGRYGTQAGILCKHPAYEPGVELATWAHGCAL